MQYLHKNNLNSISRDFFESKIILTTLKKAKNDLLLKNNKILGRKKKRKTFYNQPCDLKGRGNSPEI